MAAILRLLVFAPVAVIVVLLAMANRTPVRLSLDPLGGDAWTIQLPLFAAAIGALMLGILIGGVATWLGQGKYRRAARESAREAQAAQSEVDRLRTMVPTADAVILPPTMIR